MCSRALRLWLLTLVPAGTFAQEIPSPLPRTAEGTYEGVLVLHNGGVLSGHITRLGEWYVVRRGGGEVMVGTEKVKLVSRSLDEAYTQQRQRLAQPTADAHLALADWCLRYGLIDQAQRELTEGRALEPNHPKLRRLEKRLALLQHQMQQTKETGAVRGNIGDGKQQFENLPVSEPDHLLITTPVTKQQGITELPDGALERFTRKVQPVVVNSCTTGGCHRVGGPQHFQLDPALLYGASNRQSTTHNLSAVLALIDREQPQRSPLLTVPRRSHGGMKEPVFGPHQERAYQQLVNWVALVTAPLAASQGQTATEMTDGHQVVPANGRAEKQEELTVETTSGVVQAAQSQMRPASQQVQEAAEVADWRPKDEFDPERFNRQYSNRRAAAQNRGTTSE